MSILSLPILLPVLLLLIKITIYSVENNSVSVPYNDLAFLILLNAITLILAIILFPFLYND
jgi:heme exporter protein B